MNAMTNAPSDLLSFEKCVLKYRHQSNIESSFDDLRNKVAHLVPIYLQKDERIKGLVNLLLLALKVCAVLEYRIAGALSKNDEQLEQIYEGNPT
jgi:transposase